MITQDVSIGEAITRLAIARGGLVDDVASEVYLDGLADLSPELVVRACRELGLEKRQAFETALPEVGRIREAVSRLAQLDQQQAASAKLLPLPRRSDDEPTFHCVNCFDEPSAWRILWCPGFGALRIGDKPDRAAGVPMSRCERSKTHAPHFYTERCGCRDTNPVIAAHRARMATRPDPKSRQAGRE